MGGVKSAFRYWFSGMGRLLPVVFCAALLVTGCSTSPLPTPRVPKSERAAISDESLLANLQRDWKLLKKRGLSVEERSRIVADYNHNAYMLIRRYRENFLLARKKNNAQYMPPGVVFRQDAYDSAIPLRDIYEDMVPSSEVRIENLKEHYTEPGLGVPLVGVIPADKAALAGKKYTISTRGTVQELTAVFEMPEKAGSPVVVRLIPRARRETYRLGGMTYPLAADISAPIEVYWNLTGVKKDRILGMLRPQKLRDTTGLSCMDSYNPEKIPVILAHGLMSSAGTFDNLVNRLLADHEIREHYQFWYFNYPTGVAWTISASHYREALTKVRHQVDPKRRNKNWDNMVVLGHSMGGLITHYSQCTEPWLLLRDRKPGKIDMSRYMSARYIDTPLPFTKRITNLQRDYYFRPVTAGQVIYLATPHRGAPMAQYSITGWLMDLVELPQTVVAEVLSIATLSENSLLFSPGRMTELFTSGDQLSPKSYSICGLRGLQVRNVPTHSVIGDRGHNNSPRSSDGVVPYWSSHIPWGSETIVPSDHSVQDDPKTAEDLKRVLKEHLRRCGYCVK